MDEATIFLNIPTISNFKVTYPHLSESANPNDPDSFAATLHPPVTQWRVPGDVNSNENPMMNHPLANIMIEVPRNAHIVTPAQKMGPAASKGYPAGT